jgi:anti-sigma regulatory factor (Ser/Thr protein kinase)
MSRVAVREIVTLAARAERARVARAFTGGVLGPGHPCADDAVLLVSELFGNSVRHGGSGAVGETVTVAVTAGDGVVRVEIAGRSGASVPEVGAAGRMPKAAGGLSLWRVLRRGGGGGGVAAGR